MREEEFVRHFAENIKMILAHEAACAWCVEFFYRNGLVQARIKTLEGRICSSYEVVEYLSAYYTKKEEYDKLGKLMRISSMPAQLSIIEMHELNAQAKTVLSFEENCEVCWGVLEDEDTVPFYSCDAYNIHLDFVSFMTILVNPLPRH